MDKLQNKISLKLKKVAKNPKGVVSHKDIFILLSNPEKWNFFKSFPNI